MLSKHTLVITLIDELPAVTAWGAERCVVRRANCRMRQYGRGVGARQASGEGAGHRLGTRTACARNDNAHSRE